MDLEPGGFHSLLYAFKGLAVHLQSNRAEDAEEYGVSYAVASVVAGTANQACGAIIALI